MLLVFLRIKKIYFGNSKDSKSVNILFAHPVYKPICADFPRNPAEVFDLFLDDDAINLLTNETINYASQKDNHQFSLTPGEMREFIGILLLSGYCTVPRRRLYWATKSDTYNKMVATTMRQNRFERL